MKRYLFCISVLCLATGFFPLAALDGSVVTVSGKVEYQDTSGIWKPLKGGDKVASGTVISTGFKSEAIVKLGASILTIKPLTRMTLTQLVEKEDTVNTELYLEVGNVKAEVNSLNSKKNGFTVKSPVATASVRGTVFELGDQLIVEQGSVWYSSPVGQIRIGSAGQELQMFEDAVASPVTILQTKMDKIQLSDLPSTEVKSPILITTAAAGAEPLAVSADSPVPNETITALVMD